MKSYMATLESFSPEVGADTLLWLATAPAAGRVTGGYFHRREALTPSTAALDDEAAARLCAESESLVARAGV